MTRIIGAGLVTVDLIYLCDQKWQPLNHIPVYTSGGTVCNILSHLAKFGWECNIIGGIGEDALAKVITTDLESFGVKTDALIPYPDSLTRRIAHLIATGRVDSPHRFQTNCLLCHKNFPPFPILKYEQVSEACEKLISRDTVLVIDRANEITLELVTRVSEAGGVIVFEPGYLTKNRDLIKEILSKVDLLKYSTELKWQHMSFSKALRSGSLGDYKRIKLIIETRGPKGIVITHGRRVIVRNAPLANINIVDSAGAGDAFTAGLLTGIGQEGLYNLREIDDDKLEEATDRGQALGALACLFVSSKGVLYANTAAGIEAAIRSTKTNLQPPSNFGSAELPEGVVVDSTGSDNKLCPACKIPSD